MKAKLTIQLPFIIGDSAWLVRYYHHKKVIKSGIVSELSFTDDMELVACVRCIGRGIVGKKIFASREEAEAASEGED